MSNRGELLAQLDVIVDFAVEDQGKAAIFTRHWLRAAANIDNRQPAMAEADLKSPIKRLVKPIAGAVRPPMKHQISEADECLAILMLRGLKNPSKYPAHLRCPFGRQADDCRYN